MAILDELILVAGIDHVRHQQPIIQAAKHRRIEPRESHNRSRILFRHRCLQIGNCGMKNFLPSLAHLHKVTEDW